MPVIDLPLERVNSLLKKELTIDELEEYSLQLGADVEEKNAESIKIEYNPNRPDYCSVPGFSRSLKGIIGLEKGIPDYQLKKGNITVEVDPSVIPLRGFIQCAVIRDLHFDETLIAELMNIQEALHWVIGRDRKKVSIGIHDLRSIDPPFRYYGADAKSNAFIPLEKTEKMTPKEICEEHPKGKKYAHLVTHDGKVPLLVDSNDGVLSFPPIINGILTKVGNKTTDLFIDVTGPSESAVDSTLEILTTSFAEEGHQIETVTILRPDDEAITTPHFNTTSMALNPDYVNEILGTDFSLDVIKENLLKARLGIKNTKKSAKSPKLEVIIPSYRIDILHEVDLVEEVAISYGYHRIEPELDPLRTIGREHPIYKLQNKCREIMAGLGFLEMVNFTLVSDKWHYDNMKTSGKPVTLLNPVSKEFTIFRDSLLPGLLKNLQTNKPNPLPQRIFEVSDISRLDKNEETKATREIFLAGAICHSTVDFVEVKSTVEAVLRAMGIESYTMISKDHPSFFEGRCAAVSINDQQVGLFGEVHPEVLTNFELDNPVGIFEFEIEKIV